MEFCKLFNARSLELYSASIPLGLKIYKKQGLPLKYNYQPISFYALVVNFCLYFNKSKAIYYSQLYDILVIRLINLERLGFTPNSKLIAKQLFGFLNSTSVIVKK